MKDRTLKVNGVEFDLDTVARALGVGEKAREVCLCQHTPAGLLKAQCFMEGLDIRLERPGVVDLPLSYTEYYNGDSVDGEGEVKTFLYDLADSYCAFVRHDVQTTDEDIEQGGYPHTVVVASGDHDRDVVVLAENRHVRFIRA